MTLIVGDHLIIKRGGKTVEGEAYHEFEVMKSEWIGSYGGDSYGGKTGYRVELKVIE